MKIKFFIPFGLKGDNYNYEKGKYKVVPVRWNEQQQTLVIDKQQGSYTGALQKQVFNIVWVNESKGYGINSSPLSNLVVYKGEKISIAKK